MLYTEPVVTVLARPSFREPAHLPVSWVGESSDGERLAEFAGRICYMSQHNPAQRTTADYLENIKKQGHGSVLEHANYTLLLEGVSRSLTHELVRHRAGFAYCLAGDTRIYSEHRQGGRRNGTKKRTIRQLFEMTLTPHGRSRLKLLRLRCLDEATGTFRTGKVADVAFSGRKPVFRVVLEDGKTITCTKEHRFLTPAGWRSLDEAVRGLTISRSGIAVTGGLDDAYLMVNGVEAYRDAAWLRTQYHELGLDQATIGRLAGVSTHCIRSWVRRHGLQKPLGSWTVGREPWNKGREYSAGWHHSPETRAQLSAAKQGENNPQWRGGITRDAVAIRRPVQALRAQVFGRDEHRCRLCATRGGRLTVHHVVPAWARPDLADQLDNLATLCRSCHLQVNGHELDYVERLGGSIAEVPAESVRNLGTGRLLVPRARRIVSITYAGEVDTYDIEMAGPNQNFVAEGIVTHNSQLSQRYVDESEANFVVPPAVVGDAALETAWRAQVEQAQAAYVSLVDTLMERYAWVGDKVHRRKMAREAARGVLPNSTETKIVVTGNARAWRTMLELRAGEGAELEIRRLAVAVLRVLVKEAPAFFSDFEIYQAGDRREAARVGFHKV